MTAPLTILDRMTALYGELLESARTDAEHDAVVDSGLEDAIAEAYVAIKCISEREPETRAEREADYYVDLARGRRL